MKEWDLCKCFQAFNTLLFIQKLLQLVLWNKKVPLKEQVHNSFSEINILFSFSQINHRLYFKMDGCNKCYKINTVFMKYGSLQAFPAKKWHYHKKNGWQEMMWSYNRLLSIYAYLKPRRYHN